MELFEKLGIDPVILIAQIINFLVLVFLLTKFLYKPILKVLDERQKKIKKGLEEAERIKIKTQEIDKLSEEKIKKSLVEAQKIVQQAKEQAEKSKQGILEKTSQEIEEMKTKMAKEIDASQEAMIDKVRKEAAGMLTSALSRLLINLDPKIHHQLIKQAIKEIKKLKG